MKYYVDFAAKSGFPYMLIDAAVVSAQRHHTYERNCGCAGGGALCRSEEREGVDLAHLQTCRRTDGRSVSAVSEVGCRRSENRFCGARRSKGNRLLLSRSGSGCRASSDAGLSRRDKPTGINRTYPNVLGYEAVLGMEQSKVGMRDNPDHRTTLPFTRMLAGRMDYTPGGFDNVTRDDFVARSLHPEVMGTRAQQLAMYVVYDAPFQMVSDTPKAYEDQPAFEFIRHCPTTWDETRVLNGRPAEYITVVRRSGNMWFLGAMTNWDAREIEVPLRFLGSGRYTGRSVRGC